MPPRRSRAAAVLHADGDRSGGAIATAEANGKDVTAAQASLTSMNGEVAAAMALASPLPGRLLPLTAAQWNAGTAGRL